MNKMVYVPYSGSSENAPQPPETDQLEYYKLIVKKNYFFIILAEKIVHEFSLCINYANAEQVNSEIFGIWVLY